MAISRLPSHGFFVGSPPKLHGHETVQLQLSATVAVTCQFGAAARGGTATATRHVAMRAMSLRIARACAFRLSLSRDGRGATGTPLETCRRMSPKILLGC